MFDLADRHPGVLYPMLGLYPGSVNQGWREEIDRMMEYSDRSVVALGEIGLDYYYGKAFAKEQKEAPRAPERLVALTNGQVELTFSSRGAAIVKVKMLQYAERPGAIADDNPPVAFDLSARPALALDGVQGLAAEDVPAEPAK